MGTGCGDDEPSDAGVAGTGGGSGAAGAAGMSGGGGAAGMTPPTAAQCTMTTETNTMGRNRAGCSACLCQMGLQAANACNGVAACWQLIGCISQNCPNDPASSCAISGPCAQFAAAGATTATALGMVLRGACGSVCIAPTTDTDGGGDAGL